MKHTRPKGTRDFVPAEARRKHWAEEQFRLIARRYGFEEITTPTLEHTELFIRSSGETSDIVTKEMYTFKDRSDRSVTLRPEGTPGVVRALLENQLRVPCRLCYLGPMFRYVRPQKGRYREFIQFGVESFGEASPQVDAEVIALGDEFFAALGITDRTAQVNSIGCRECRPAYHEKLKAYLAQFESQLCPDCRVRAVRNPLRVFDCKNAACQTLLEQAPRSKENLCPACAEHFSGVIAALTERRVGYALNDRLVRGLDYYSRTAFEYVPQSSGAQDSLGGGGRYDYLVEDFGGPRTPAIGFALGVDRALLVAPPAQELESPLVFVVAMGETERAPARALLAELRRAGIAARMDYDHVKARAQFHAADAAGAQYCAILGSDELVKGVVALKDMKTGEQREVKRTELIAALGRRSQG